MVVMALLPRLYSGLGPENRCPEETRPLTFATFVSIGQTAIKKTMSEQLPIADDDSIVHFGRHKGKPISKVDASYLIWIWNNGMKNKTKLRGEDGNFARYIKKELYNLSREEPDMIIDKEAN